MINRNALVVVGLEILNDDPEHNFFRNISFKSQLIWLQNRITDICEILQEKHPDAHWIITWREFGITNGSHRFLDNNQKIEFKKTLLNISKQFNNLELISGPIASKKIFETLDPIRLTRIQSYYKNLPKIIKKEKTQNRFYMKTKNVNKNNVIIARNTCYLFHQNQVQMRHNKTTPYDNELDDTSDKELENALFQPGNKQGNTQHCKFVVEICREQTFGVLKSKFKNNEPDQMPLIHFILSDGNPIFENNVIGKYLIHLDSEEKMEVIDARPNEKTSEIIHFYSSNLFEYPTNLVSSPILSFKESNYVVPEFIRVLCLDPHVDLEYFQTLTSNKEELNQTYCDTYPIFEIINQGTNEILQIFLEQGGDPNLNNKNGISPLMFACYLKKTSMILLLLQHDADPNYFYNNISPLGVAIFQKIYPAVKALLEHKADPNVRLKNLPPFLHHTIKSNTYLLAEWLLDHGADPNEVYNGQTAWQLAESLGYRDFTDLLNEKRPKLPFHGK